MASFKTKCDFCSYALRGSEGKKGCMVTPDSAYCKEALDEYYQYLKSRRAPQQPQKSSRPWTKK